MKSKFSYKIYILVHYIRICLVFWFLGILAGLVRPPHTCVYACVCSYHNVWFLSVETIYAGSTVRQIDLMLVIYQKFKENKVTTKIYHLHADQVIYMGIDQSKKVVGVCCQSISFVALNVRWIRKRVNVSTLLFKRKPSPTIYSNHPTIYSRFENALFRMLKIKLLFS
jgi:hypothetical protein